MFKNVGKKIKKLAKVVFIIGIIVFTIVFTKSSIYKNY